MVRQLRPLHARLKPVKVLKRPKGQYLKWYDDDLDRGEKLLVREAIDFYWHNAPMSDLTRYTAAIYVSTVRSLLGHLTIADINAEITNRYQRERATRSCTIDHIGTGEKVTLKPAAETSTRKELVKLKAAINFAMRQGLVETKYKPAYPMPSAEGRRETWLTKEQGLFLLKAARTRMQNKGGPHNRRVFAFVLLALMTGARRRAIEQLPWSAIDFEKNVIDFRKPGLNSARKRRVVLHMSKELRDELWALRNDGIGNLQTFVLGDYGSDRAYAPVKTFLKNVGFEWVTPHVFRHTYITWAIQDGFTPREISDYLGVSEAIIRQVYAHHNPYMPSRMSARRLFDDGTAQTEHPHPSGS